MKEEKKQNEYKIRTIRMTDKTWQKLKDKRWASKKGWEKFVLQLIKENK